MEFYQALIALIGSALTSLIGLQVWTTKSLFKRMFDQHDRREAQFISVTKALNDAIEQSKHQAALMKQALESLRDAQKEESQRNDKILAHMAAHGVALDKMISALEIMSQKSDALIAHVQRELDALRRDLAKNR